MKKSIKFITGAALTLMFYLIITAYGNTKIHRGLNGLMINRFEDSFITSSSPLARFKNYVILLKSERLYKGEAIINSGYLEVDSEIRKFPAYKWIQEGGFSADEPEIFASFRHFYDPTKNEGDRYLHDHLDYLDSKGVVNQPKIDHIEWALIHPMHQYNWKNGKTAVISALSSHDPDFKNEEMAFAFRALGETLHMIADMGCPAHVRDDAHASKAIAGYKLGSPDMYEEYAELFNVSSFDITKVDPDLKNSFRSATATVESIAKTLAKYTNENFFTGQTIYGEDKDGELVKPIIHADNPYHLPNLNDCTYDISTIGYYKKISGQDVLMCRDHYYSRFYKGYPYIDRACAESQAKVLFPQIVEAGANVIRLFIPQLEVKITEYDPTIKMIKGKVEHKPTEEYPKNINYNGKVEIYDMKTLKLITEVDCKDGKFEEEIKLRDFKKVDWKKGIYAKIKFGNFEVDSEPFIDKELMVTSISISIDLDQSQINIIYKYDYSPEPSVGYYLSEDSWEHTIEHNNNKIITKLDTAYSYNDDYWGYSYTIEKKSSFEIIVTESPKSLNFIFSLYEKQTGSDGTWFVINRNASFSGLQFSHNEGTYDIYELKGNGACGVSISSSYDSDLSTSNLANTACSNNSFIRVRLQYN